jgi:uncharacterized membrane protein YdjX (TVP38/TMEM64 family)
MTEGHRANSQRRRRLSRGSIVSASVGLLSIAALVIVYFYYLHTGRVHDFMRTVHGLGLLGILLGIALMALASVLPVPSEFLSIFLLRFYGVFWGTVFSWTGGILGAVAALFVARLLARPLAEHFAGRYVNQLQPWLTSHGWLGLLVARFIPFVPYHVVNYVAGILRVRIWPFIWTTALGTLPFQLALSGVYYGVSYGALPIALAGFALFAAILFLAWRFRDRFLPTTSRD